MKANFKVFIYPFDSNSSKQMFVNFGPKAPNPGGNYATEHFFFTNLYDSPYLTQNPEEADLFVLPFSVFNIRITLGPDNVPGYVRDYMPTVVQDWPYWNRTEGADHFYATCHDIGSKASEFTPYLGRSALQIVCASNVWHKTFVPHKDLSYPQIWPRPQVPAGGLPAEERSILAFWSGSQNSRVRRRVKEVWENDDEILLGEGRVLKKQIRGPDYFENFRKSKFCLHITGYQVPTARIGDAVNFGCVPVIISDQYDLPFKNILDWSEFAVILAEVDIPNLKKILKKADYPRLYRNTQIVRRFFTWHAPSKEYDLFDMLMYELWIRRFVLRPALDE